MLTRIRLHNYMSHADTQLELHPGVNVIIGPNNCGKSAIVSALQTLLGENAGDYMVRHGEKECVVEVHTDDPHVIVWKRRGGAIRYQIDGKEFARAGRGNFPDEFHEAVRLAKVTTADDKKCFDVHFGQQKSPIFLLDSESDTAKFFSTTSDAERLIEMQVRHRNNTRDAAARHKDATRALGLLDARLATLNPLDELDLQIEQVDSAERGLLDGAAELARVETLRSQLTTAQAACLRLRGLRAELSHLTEPPRLEDTASLETAIEQQARAERVLGRQRQDVETLCVLDTPPDWADVSLVAAAIENLDKAERRLVQARQVHRVLEAVEPAPVVPDVAPFTQLLLDLDTCRNECARWVATAECLAPLSDAPTGEDTTVIERYVRSISEATIAVRNEQERHRCLGALREPAAQEDPTGLMERVQLIEQATQVVAERRSTLHRLGLEVAELEAQAELWRKDNPYCPTCGQTLLAHQPILDGSKHGALHEHC